jgi:hypothetical protein
MSEKFANINISNGESVDATRFNTSVYNHYGQGELYDHVWVQKDETTGIYIWKQIPPENPAYAALAPIAVEHGCETHINIQTVAEADLRAFGKAAIGDIESIPDWLPEV